VEKLFTSDVEDQESCFEFTQRQLELWEAASSGDFELIFFGGAIRGGKTLGAFGCLVTLANTYEGSRWAIVRRDLPSLLRTSWPSFKKVCPPHFIQEQPTSGNEYTIHLRNGSQILLFTENYQRDKDYDRWKGLEVNGFVLEQVEELQLSTLLKAIERAGTWLLKDTARQPIVLVLATLNPSQGWPYEVLYKPWRQGTLPKRWCYLPASISDNPHIPEKYRESLRANLDPISYARFVEGDWEAQRADKPFAWAFRAEKHIHADSVLQRNTPIYLSFDFNVDPGCCIIAQHGYDESAQPYIHIIAELRQSNTDIYRMCSTLRDAYPEAVFLVTGDASGQNRSVLTRGQITAYHIIRQELQLNRGSLKLPKFNPPLLDSRILLNRMLEIHPALHIHPSCQYLITDLEQVEVDAEGKPDKSQAHLTHLLDAFRYYLHSFHGEWLKHAEAGRLIHAS
jgi:hypothetical protein